VTVIKEILAVSGDWLWSSKLSGLVSSLSDICNSTIYSLV